MSSKISVIVMLLAVGGCNAKSGSGGATGSATGSGSAAAPSTGTSIKDKVQAGVAKVDHALDSLDSNEATTHYDNAQKVLAAGGDPVEDCGWVGHITDSAITDAIAKPVMDLRALCSYEAPLARATKAVVKAEKAKADQPGAPSYTECSSDSYPAALKAIDAAGESFNSRTLEITARWKKVCPAAP